MILYNDALMPSYINPNRIQFITCHIVKGQDDEDYYQIDVVYSSDCVLTVVSRRERFEDNWKIIVDTLERYSTSETLNNRFKGPAPFPADNLPPVRN